MIRRLYQVTLIALQVALLAQIGPPLAQALRHGAAFGAFPHGALAVVQIASSVAAIGGGALVLAFPMFALLRHRQRGPIRFGGLPRWSVALALAGAMVYAVGTSLTGVVPLRHSKRIAPIDQTSVRASSPASPPACSGDM